MSASHRITTLGGCMLIMAAIPATAGLLDKVLDAATREAEKTAERNIDQKIDGVVQCIDTDLRCIREAEQNGQEILITDDKGHVVDHRAAAAQPASPSASGSSATATLPGRSVGRIEILIDGETRVFDVRAAAPSAGVATGYAIPMTGEKEIVAATLHGFDPASGDELTLSVAFDAASGDHHCDPFGNEVSLSADDGRDNFDLVSGGRTSTTCPPQPGVIGYGLTQHLDLTEAAIDRSSGEVRVAGEFSGWFEGGGEPLWVREGRYEATLQPIGPY